MNILFIASFRITPNSGGVQRVTEVLAAEFVRLGYGVFYLALDKGEEEIIQGIKQFYLPEGNNFRSVVNKKYVTELIKTKEIDIIINQIGFFIPQMRFINECRTLNVRILTVHHNCVTCLNEQYHNLYSKTLKSMGLDTILNNKAGWWLLKKLHKIKFSHEIRKTIDLSDKVVLLAQSFIPEIKFYVGSYKQEKITAIINPNSFKTKRIDFSVKENRIVYVGRLSIVQKRVERLIEVWEKLYREFPNWEFDIVGDGPHRMYIENLAKEKGLKKIHFYGFQDPKPFLERAKIFTMTSDYEGFGMVLVEAQTYGVVPIVFNCFSSIHDIIDDGISGIIIEKFDLSKYIEELRTLMKEENVSLMKMGKNGINNVENFSVDFVAQEWIKLFDELK